MARQSDGFLSEYGFQKPILSAEELSTLLKTESEEVTSSDALALFHNFQSELQRFETETPSYKIFSTTDAFSLALSDLAATPQDARDIVRVPDIVANASQGRLDLEIWYRRIVRTILLCRCVESSSSTTGSLLPVLVDTLCFNYSSADAVMEEFVADCGQHSFQNTKAHLGSIIKEIPKSKQEFVIKPVVKSASSSDIIAILGLTLPYACPDAFEKLLLARKRLPSAAHPKLVRYLSKCLTPGEMLALLEKTLVLWGDPVIAKAYVADEIMHCTKMSLLLFLYGDRGECMRSRSRIIEKLVRGLPNHFNSTDGRTVVLAKFFSEIITETLKHFESESNPVPRELQYPEEQICRQLLTDLRACEDSSQFWFLPAAEEEEQPSRVEPTDASAPKPVVSDDDDDSDLEAIETVEPQAKCNIKYIRNFLESFPETKSHQEVKDALRVIPSVIKRQLALDHPQMGKDLLNMIFLWENEFDDPVLDDHRRTSLISVLETRLDGNLEHFCKMFHRDHVQPYRKNLVFDVLSKVAKNANLKDLQTICNASFRHLLLGNDTINRQDVTVRIPFVLYLSRLLCLLPEQMLTEDAVVSYLSALKSLQDVDAATEQTICYALNNVMTAIGDKKMAAATVRTSIRDTRDWLLAIQSSR